MSDFKKDKPINLTDYRNDKAGQEIDERVYNSLERAREHNEFAPNRFLEEWKKGIKLVGVEFFNITSETIDAASDKWQLAPNLEFIKQAAGGYSHGRQVLLALMYSFFDSEDGQKLLERFGTPNLVDALVVLDLEGREIVATLWKNYSGW
jgi:hypothetical protein